MSGIFSVGARAAGDFAGPAVTVAFMLAALACALAIMCYAEFASTIPVAGSAYTYTYATLGEFLAWIIGWDLILERSEEHTSELQSLMRISYAVFCLKKKNYTNSPDTS